MKCDVMKRKDEPKRVKERPTAPLVLMRVPGLVAKLEVQTAVYNYIKAKSSNLIYLKFFA